MPLKLFLPTLLSVWMMGTRTTHRLELTPFDFQNERLGYPEFYFSNYKQIVRSGSKLYMIGDEPFVLEVDYKTKACRKLGRRGEGPGEFPGPPYAIAVHGENLWVVEGSRRQYAYRFVNGEYQGKLKIKAIGPDCAICSRSFGVSDHGLVIAVTPKTGNLAMAYGFDGKREGIGDLFFEEDAALLRKVPEMNHTIWTYGDHFLFGVLPSYPMVLRYDRDFRLINSFPLDHPLLQKRFTDLVDWTPPVPDAAAIPIIMDFEYFNGSLFVMGNNHLFQIDPLTGGIRSVSRFIGKGEEFAKVTGPLSLPLFTFLEDGTLVVANHMSGIWGHDLWIVKDPPFFDK